MLILLPIVFFLYSNFQSIDKSLKLRNFFNIFSDSRQQLLLVRSLLISIGATTFATFIGMTLGILIAKCRIPFKRFFTIIFISPLLIPPYIIGICWITLLGQKGWINNILIKILDIKKPLFTIYGTFACVCVLAFAYFPIIFISTLSGFKSIEQSYEDAALLITSRKKVIMKVLIPLISPILIPAMIFVFILSIADFGVPALLRVNVYTVEIFTQFGAFYDFRKATSTAMPLLFIIISTILVQQMIFKKRELIILTGKRRNLKLWELGIWKHICLIYFIIISVITLILPVIVLISDTLEIGLYKKAIINGFIPIKSSILFSALSATLSIVIVLFISLQKIRTRRDKIVEILVLLPFILPGSIVGLALINFWNKGGIYQLVYGSFLIIIIAHLIRFLFIPYIIIGNSYRQIDDSLEQAGYICGGKLWRVLSKIIIPLLKPSILSAWVIFFILSVGELAMTIMIYPPGYETLPIRLFSQMHYGPYALVHSFCITMILISLIPIMFVYFFISKGIKG